MIEIIKSILTLFLLTISSAISAATYYVATTGNDSNDGSISSPFKTINKAWSVVTAGDLVYIRGGVYTYSMMPPTVLSNKDGSPGNLIKIWSYPGEKPVINYNALTVSGIGISMRNSDYVHLKGIRVTGIRQPNQNDAPASYGLILWNDVNNCIFENMEFDHIGGWGAVLGEYCSNNLFLNCDSHHNSDPYSQSPYGGSDGFETGAVNSTNNAFRGCRAWSNSDDGFDYRLNKGTVILENCWSFRNGYIPGTWSNAGNGVGYKLGQIADSHNPNVLRTLTRCLAFDNRNIGFHHSAYGGVYDFAVVMYNNTAYRNYGTGFNFGPLATGVKDILRNNVSYANISDWVEAATHDHNSWNGGVTVNGADFTSLDTTGVSGPRQADGSLPDISFLKLATGSDLINTGVNVGLAYGGTAPDLGAFETQLTSVPPPSPAYLSSAIENASPAALEMTFNLTLANIVPVASAFTVLVNSVSRPVNSVAISGAKVLLTLSSPIIYGDAVTVAYTKPSISPLQTPAGGQAASFSAQTVTNKVTPPVPVYVSSSVENATPSRVDLVYSMTLANIVPAVSSFAVMVNSVARTINTVSISGTNVLLTLSSPVLAGESVTVTYTKPSANPLQTPSGGLAATLGATTITNKVIAPGIPMFVSSALENVTPSRIDITYSLSLSNIVPAASSFTVLVNSVAKTVSSVAVSGTKVTLTLANPVAFGDVITVAYAKPASNPLQATSGGQANTISAQIVKNNISPPNPVYASSAIENAAPSKLVITYNLALANIVPAASAFTVFVNSAARAVNSVAISGTTVQLTLASAVRSGDVITVAYTKPSSSPVQTAPGGQAAAFTAQSVTNRVSSIPVPVFTGAGVENATPTVIEMYYSLALANILPALTSFTVKVNSVSKNVIAVSVSGSKVLLTLANGIISEDIVTISYTKPAANPLQTPGGGMAASIDVQQITNKVTPNGPVYVSSVIENATPNTIEVTYNEVLNPSAPGVSAFLVQVNGVNRPVTSVTINGKKVILLLESPVVKGDVVTVSYTKPAGNPLQKASGDPAVSIGPQPVTNNVQDLTVVGEIRKGIISIYPNPAVEFINFSTREASSESHIIKIFDFSGKLCLESRIDPFVENYRIPINLRSGVYIVQVIIGSLTIFTHKLLVNN